MSAADNSDDVGSIGRQVNFAIKVRVRFKEEVVRLISHEVRKLIGAMLQVGEWIIGGNSVSGDLVESWCFEIERDAIGRQKFSEVCASLILLRDETYGAYVKRALENGIEGLGFYTEFDTGAARENALLIPETSDRFIQALTDLKSPAFTSILADKDTKIVSRLPNRFRALLRQIGLHALQRAEEIAFRSEGFDAAHRSDYDRIPASNRFVRLDDNNPDVELAQEHLKELAEEVRKSNTLPLATDERAALVQEILVLAGMLQERVVRLAQVQFAISEAGVLGYVRGNFASDIRAGLVGAAIALLLKAVGLDH